MRLRIFTPMAAQIDEEIDKLVFEAVDGHRCFLPHHVDFVAPLAIGILFHGQEGSEAFVAVDGGTIVKVGDDVLVSTPRAATGDLGMLREVVEESFRQLEDRERAARSALLRMETDVIQRMIELEEHVTG